MKTTETSTDDRRSTAGTACRIGAAVAVLVSGLVHLQLYLDGYRNIPDIGRSFVLNVAASVVIAVALVWRRELVVRLAAAGLLGGTLVAFALSRTGDGILDFRERGLEPSPQAGLALAAEVLGLVLLATTCIPAVGAGDTLRPPVVAGAAAATLLIVVVSALLWAREADETVTDAAPTATSAASTSATTATAMTAPPTASGVVTVSIQDLAFRDQTIEIPVGATVEWVNEDSFTHTVESDDGSFTSEDLAPGDTFSFTFDSAGEFDYICGIHPSMLGSVLVSG